MKKERKKKKETKQVKQVAVTKHIFLAKTV